MSETDAMFAVLRQSADAATAEAIERLVEHGSDRDLCRINVLAFAAKAGLDEERTIAAFLHASRIGLFDLSWNVLCPSCGGVLDAGATLKNIDQAEYHCGFCAAGYAPNLDAVIEVAFIVSARVRRNAAHDPSTLPAPDYLSQVFWSSGVDLPEDFARAFEEVTLESLELSPGEKALVSLNLPAEFVIVFDPVTHAGLFIHVKGEPTRERQSLSVILNDVRAPTGTIDLRPGPLRIALENRSTRRALPIVWLAGAKLEALLQRRRPFVTGKRLLTNQVFRDIYRTDTLDIDQRLQITSLTFLFTDLKGSTELYDRVGDLAAFELVNEHFRLLTEIVAGEAGAVVKTIGDAVMATFPTPDRALSAALRMREAMRRFNAARHHEDLLLKIGIHEGPCLAVVLNDRQDYFGQTVNIASRVQHLAVSRSILASGSVIDHPEAAALLETSGLRPLPKHDPLRGITEDVAVYEIP